MEGSAIKASTLGMPKALIVCKSSSRPLEKYIEQPAAEKEYIAPIIVPKIQVRVYLRRIDGIIIRNNFVISLRTSEHVQSV